MRSCAWVNMSPVMCGWMRTHYVPAAPSAGDGGAEVVSLPWCGKRLISEPLLYQNDHFAKTGSGQTQAKLRKRATTFCRLLRSEQGPRGEKTALFGHFLY
jgi:hypothetical protein